MTGFVDFRSLRRPRTPNTYLVADEGMCDNCQPDAAPPIFQKSADALFRQVVSIVEQTKRWEITANSPDGRQLAFIARTPLIGFRDDVDVHVIPVGEENKESTLCIYSRSRVGRSDLGANRKRVVGFLDKLTAK